jgi:hypothetical protein
MEERGQRRCHVGTVGAGSGPLVERTYASAWAPITSVEPCIEDRIQQEGDNEETKRLAPSSFRAEKR